MEKGQERERAREGYIRGWPRLASAFGAFRSGQPLPRHRDPRERGQRGSCPRPRPQAAFSWRAGPSSLAQRVQETRALSSCCGACAEDDLREQL
jgi:hypothetical protein